MNRYLIMGLLDPAVSGIVRMRQHRLSCLTGDDRALRFPVHITLRGPFRAQDTCLRGFGEKLSEICTAFHALPLDFVGPVFIDPDLFWLEVKRSAPCFAELLRLHAALERAVGEWVVVDDTPLEFKADGYRPHVTIGWKAVNDCTEHHEASAICPIAGAVYGSLRSVAIAVYPDGWPSEGTVRVIISTPLV
jgi:2'-5' RNA ligase